MTYRFSIHSDLEKHLTEDEFLDVTLQGTDEVGVRAARFLLSVRSPVFKSMFFGGFSESSLNVVQVGFSSTTIGALVRFCCTDEIEPQTPSEEHAKELVRLATAANYYKIPLLERESCKELYVAMKSHPPLACVIFDYLSSSDDGGEREPLPELLTKHLKMAAISIIRWAPGRALLSSAKNLNGRLGVTFLSAKSLQTILADTEICANELTLFKCIKHWVFREKSIDENFPSSWSNCNNKDKSSKKEDSGAEKARLAQCKDILVKELNISNILPSDLESIVEPSGLVTTDALFSAYREQAVFAQNGGDLKARCSSERRVIEPKTKALLVIGAGVDEVNGVYIKAPKDVYKKTDLYDGKECTFIVNWSEPKSKDNNTVVIFAGEKPTDAEFYHFYMGEAEQGLPPVDEWDVDDDGADPSPVCINLEWSNGYTNFLQPQHR